MSYTEPTQLQAGYSGHSFSAGKVEDGDSQSPDGDQSNKKSVKHRRNYQACEPCRERKVKCDLGDVDNPSKGPCAKCQRESKHCWFRDTRKKQEKQEEGRSAKRQRTDSTQSSRTFAPLPHSPQLGQNFAYQSNPLSPIRPSFPPTTPPSSAPAQHSLANYSAQPRSTPTLPTPNTGFTSASMSYSNTPKRNTNGDDHVAMPQASRLAESFTNTTDNMSVLVRAATTTEAGLNSTQHQQRNRALTGSAGEVDLGSLPPQIRQPYQQAREVWSQMRFVRAGWFNADEAMQYVKYFYENLAPMTPVITHDFSNPSTHRQLLTEEPVLALAILAITSRYCELRTQGKISRGYYVHEKLWDSLRKIIQRLLWGQEQFGGGFTGAGMVATQQSATGQITWKGSLRTLGTIEALLLLTDWQPRALHFPPGDDENKLVGASTSLLDEEKPRGSDETNVPYATWLEPAWRSDRMSWMLLGLAQSLAFELGVFNLSHERCGGQHGPRSDCMQRRRIRRMVITYVSQISGRIGIQASLNPAQDYDVTGPDAQEPIDKMQKLWFDIAALMFDANRDIFPSRETTAALIDNGGYKAAISKLKPRLQKWYADYMSIQNRLEPNMRAVLRMEYEYSRLYVNSLGLQKVVGHMALQTRSKVSRGLSAQLGPVYEDNKIYIDEVRDAAQKILLASCEGLGDSGALVYSPVRTFLRTMSALMFSLKLLSLGNEEGVVRKTFKLMKKMTERMSTQVVDDVHLSPHTARLVMQLMDDVHGSMVRIAKPGSRNQSRHISPQPQQTHAGAGFTPDGESPDDFGSIPLADYDNQTFMPPPGFDSSIAYDTGLTYDANVDPALFPNNEDWISLPIDNLLNLDSTTVNQGYGGIGPTFGDRDMLSLITGTQLDQNTHGLGSGMPSGFSNFGNGF